MSADDVRPPIPASLAHRPVRGGLAAAEGVLLDRLARNSEMQGECLVWKGDHTRQGYGRIRMGNKRVLVHRAAWIARRGLPPADKPHVLHHCDNPPCWRDEHLWVGTDADNAVDRNNKRRHWQARITHCPQGHPYDDENTYRRNGKRQCWTCLRARRAAAGEVRSAAAKATREGLPPRTRCQHGHSLSDDNVGPDGRCRACDADRARQRRAEARQKAGLTAGERKRLAVANLFDERRDAIDRAQVRAASSLSWDGVHALLNRLVASGAIIKVRHGLYSAAPGISVHAAMVHSGELNE